MDGEFAWIWFGRRESRRPIMCLRLGGGEKGSPGAGTRHRQFSPSLVQLEHVEELLWASSKVPSWALHRTFRSRHVWHPRLSCQRFIVFGCLCVDQGRARPTNQIVTLLGPPRLLQRRVTGNDT
jgi:hypothetical protein